MAAQVSKDTNLAVVPQREPAKKKGEEAVEKKVQEIIPAVGALQLGAVAADHAKMKARAENLQLDNSQLDEIRAWLDDA